MSKTIELDVKFDTVMEQSTILGNNDKNINILSSFFDFKIFSRGEVIYVETEDDSLIKSINNTFIVLKKIVNRNIVIYERDIIYIAKLCIENKQDEILDLYTERFEIIKTLAGKPIFAKTLNQKHYIKSIDKSDMVFGIGPAGTGKTYLAVIKGLELLRKGQVKKLILTRPAVEAGEKLGFLPGDLKEKVDPYLRPLYDALYEVIGTKSTDEWIDKGIIEIAPLAYMRGRTLDNAYVILDEAQNTTENQMKLFLTRLGFNSKMVITGDITQIDLPRNIKSGLITSTKILKDVNEIKIIEFERIDVVRHPLVQKVIKKYEIYEA